MIDFSRTTARILALVSLRGAIAYVFSVWRPPQRDDHRASGAALLQMCSPDGSCCTRAEKLVHTVLYPRDPIRNHLPDPLQFLRHKVQNQRRTEGEAVRLSDGRQSVAIPREARVSAFNQSSPTRLRFLP